MNVDVNDDADRSASEGGQLRQVAEAVAALHRQIGVDKGRGSLQRLVEKGATDLVGARWASVTVLQRGRFRTLVSTAPQADLIDETQYRLQRGPCVDAVLEDATFVTPDIASEDRWQPLGEQLRDLGVHSMLAYRLHLLD